MIVKLEEIEKLCNAPFYEEDMIAYLKSEILAAQKYLNLLHDAEGKSDSDSKDFVYNGVICKYSVIAEQILFIVALKSILVELVVFGKDDIEFKDTVYDMCNNYEIGMQEYL
jgi:hypothetical protein